MPFQALLVVFIAFRVLLAAEYTPQAEKKVWVLQQDFVKLGKKDAYESFLKEWLQKLKTTKGMKQSRLVFQDLDSLQYFHMTPLQNYEAISSLYAPAGAAWSSLLNFQMQSIHRYQTYLSFIPSTEEDNFSLRPYLYYVIYGLVPGSEMAFEKRFKNLIQEHKKKKSTACWRIWKVEFGSDVPKYIVGLFAAKKDDLEEQIEEISFLEPANDEIVRRKREGRAQFRPELSLTDSGRY